MLIVAHHFVVNSGLTSESANYSEPLSGQSLFLLLFGAWGKTGINCFVLITGYFMCRSNITIRKFVKLLGGGVMFYRIVIYLVFFLTGYEAFSISSFTKAIIPINQIGTNFTSCFIVFYLCIPFLNILVHHLSEKQHVRLLCLLGFLYILLGTAHRVTMNYVSWFIVLYFIASYIRLYPHKCFSNTKLWGWLTLIILIISSISVISSTWLGTRINRHMHYAFVADSNTLLAVALGISSFLFFKNVKIPYNRLINTIAVSTFGVLCIHANSDTMRRWLWGDLLDNTGHYGSPIMPLYAVGCVIGVFVVCVLIDMARIQCVEKFFSGYGIQSGIIWKGNIRLPKTKCCLN